MAKKKTKKETTEEVVEERKEPKMVKVTFDPQFSAAQVKMIYLRELENQIVGNAARKRFRSMVNGLPQKLVVHKGEVITMTENQFLALYHLGMIDTPQTLKAKRDDFYSIKNQAGVDPKEHRSAESIAYIYEDNLIRIA